MDKKTMNETASQTIHHESEEKIKVENNFKTISPKSNKWRRNGLPDLGSSITATKAKIKRHVANIQMQRIQKMRAERNMNAARWSMVNTSGVKGLTSGESMDELMTASVDSRINLLSKDDVALLVD